MLTVLDRGGIPVCFPQFSDFGPLGQHGFARNTAFEVLSSAPGTVSLVLRSNDATRGAWPHDFELVVTVRAPALQQLAASNYLLRPVHAN